MMLRSITLLMPSAEHRDAVLLFGFAIPQINKRFLVYTLNEEPHSGVVRLYLAALFNEGGHYSLGALETDRDRVLALQVLDQIVKGAST